MSTPPVDPPTPMPDTRPGAGPASEDAAAPPSPGERPFIERPGPGEQPLGFLRLLIILMSSHLGVRSRANREEDFRRANGLHVFAAGVIYFLLVVIILIVVANVITR